MAQAPVFAIRPVSWAGFAGAAAGLAAAGLLDNRERGFWATAAFTVPAGFAGFLAAEAAWGARHALTEAARLPAVLLGPGRESLFRMRDLAEAGLDVPGVFSSAAASAMGELAMEFYGRSPAGSALPEKDPVQLEQRARELIARIEQMASAGGEASYGPLAAFDFSVSAARARGFPEEEFMKLPKLADVEHVGAERIQNGMQSVFEADLRRLAGRPEALREYLSRLVSQLEPLASGAIEPAPVLLQNPSLSYTLAAGSSQAVLAEEPKRVRFSFSADEIAEVARHYPALEQPLRQAGSSGAFEQALLVRLPSGKPLGIEFLRGGRKLRVPFVDPESGMTRIGESYQLAGAARRILHGEQDSPLDVYLLSRVSEDWEALERTTQKAVVWRASHVDDEFMQALTGTADPSAAVYSELTPETAWFRRHQLVPTELPEFDGKTVEELTLEEREAWLRRLGEKIRKYGSESSFRKMVLEDPEIEKIRIGQLFSMKKQDPVFRSFSKPYRIRPESVPDFFEPRLLPSKLSEIFQGRVPAARLRFAGVSPHLVAFFGDLPEDVSMLSHAPVRRTLLARLVEDIRADFAEISPSQAEGLAEAALRRLEVMWREKPDWMREARAIGTLGETEFLAADRVRRIEASERLSYRLRAVNTKVLSKDSPVRFERGELLGYDLEGRPVVLESQSARLVSLTNQASAGEVRLVLETAEPLASGMKMDVLGRKGLMTFSEQSHAHRARIAALNAIHEATGRGRPYLRSADVLVNQAYFSTDLGEESFQALLEAAQMVAETAPGAEPAASWLEDLSREGFRIERPDGRRLRLIEDSEAVAALDDAGRAARIGRLMGRTRQFLAEMEPLAGSLQADWASAWRSMAQAGRQIPLEQFIRLYYQPGTAAVWDSTTREMPRQVRLTYDVLSELHRAGEFEALSDILSRAQPIDGSAPETYRFLTTLLGGQWDPPPDASVIPLSQIGLLPRSREPGALAGTIFDPEFAATRSNYWIDLGETVSFELDGRILHTRHLPALGTSAYLGGSHRFGAGQRALSAYQTVLQRTIETIQAGGPEAAPAALAAYFRDVLPGLVGKEGLWRQPLLASSSVVGAIQSRPSRSWFEDGGRMVRNPFEVVISREFLPELPASVAERLRAGKEVHALAFRHPVSATPFVQVRLAETDDFVGSRIIGIDEGLRSLLQADSDRDFLNLIFLRSREAIERARQAIGRPARMPEQAAPPPGSVLGERLREALGLSAASGAPQAGRALEQAALPPASRMSTQWKQVRAAQLLQGTAEDVTRMTAEWTRAQRAAGLYEDVEKVLLAARSTPGGLAPERMQALVHRLAGDTIGAYSNLLSTLYLSLEHHPAVPVAGLDQTILHALLWNIRQVPISAAKGKMGLGEEPMRLYWQMLSGLRAADTEAGARIFIDAVRQISEGTQFESVITSQRDLDDIAALFGITEIGEGPARRPLRMGDRLNLFAEITRSQRGQRLLRDFVVHRNRDVDAVATLLTRGDMSAEEAVHVLERLRRSPVSAAPYLRGGLAGEKLAASSSAAALGAINRGLSEAAAEIGRRFRKALPVVAASLGLAGLAGLLATPLRSAGGDIRPAVPDVAPGEEHRGLGSHRPPVRMRPRRGGPERVMAAPDGADSVMEVETEARGEADWETLRRAAVGESDPRRVSVEIRRRSGPGDAGRLRRQEKLRDELHREIPF